MSETKISLKNLEYSPNVNPLCEPQKITIRKRYSKSVKVSDMADVTTGEVVGVNAIRRTEYKDDEHFVKVFSAGIAASFELNRTSQRVFHAILQAYEREPLTGGYADAVNLAWFDGGLCGRDIGMSDRTFQRGLKDLLAKGFLAPRMPNIYWVNPSLFFKGDRVVFMREFVRVRKSEDEKMRDQSEAMGQQRLTE